MGRNKERRRRRSICSSRNSGSLDNGLAEKACINCCGGKCDIFISVATSGSRKNARGFVAVAVLLTHFPAKRKMEVQEEIGGQEGWMAERIEARVMLFSLSLHLSGRYQISQPPARRRGSVFAPK